MQRLRKCMEPPVLHVWIKILLQACMVLPASLPRSSCRHVLRFLQGCFKRITCLGGGVSAMLLVVLVLCLHAAGAPVPARKSCFAVSCCSLCWQLCVCVRAQCVACMLPVHICVVLPAVVLCFASLGKKQEAESVLKSTTLSPLHVSCLHAQSLCPPAVCQPHLTSRVVTQYYYFQCLLLLARGRCARARCVFDLG
jgi:hypothetical protein